MISPIYKVRNRGQVVTEACQWIGENMRLALRIVVYPTLLVGLLLALNYIFFDNWLIYFLVVLFCGLIVPVQVNFMFHVVENPDEFDYPNKMPRIRQLMNHWWYYYWPFLKISILGALIYVVSFITMIGPMAVAFALPLAIVIAQREEDSGFSACTTSVKLIFQSFWNFCMCYLGSMIIMYSLVFSPYVVWLGISQFIRFFISKQLYGQMNSFFGSDSFMLIATCFAIFGAVLGFHINMVVYHFFYGHAKEKQEHPALIDEIDRFDEK